MGSYAIVNLKELEDVTSDRVPQIEGRFARRALESEHLGISYFRYAAGFRSPMAHHHSEQEEAYVVVSGSGRIKLDDEIRDLRQWDVVRVSPPVLRTLESGPDGLELIVIGSDRPEEGDGEMVPSDWTD